jgi:tripartite-type tricarboxylate transporter receptor subunit TctC
MRIARRTMVRIAGLVLFQTALAVCGAKAESYPSRAITMIVPYPAGGPSDTLARVITDRMKTALGQSVIIENVTGAGGSIGTGRVARSAPDGYTLALGHNQTHVINAVTQNLQYDVVKDFEPVTLVADTPQWLVARKTLPADDTKSFIAWLKQQDGKATSGTVGVGGPADLAAAFFQKVTGTKFQLVPYRGGAPLAQDMLAGQIDFTFGQAANYLGHVRSGTLKPFAVLARKRWWAAPDVPTMDEAGVPGLYASFWHGLWAPKDTPKEIIAKLDAAMVETLADETVKKRMADIGQEVWPADQQNPAALAAQQQAEIERWWPIIKAAGIKSE